MWDWGIIQTLIKLIKLMFVRSFVHLFVRSLIHSTYVFVPVFKKG